MQTLPRRDGRALADSVVPDNSRRSQLEAQRHRELPTRDNGHEHHGAEGAGAGIRLQGRGEGGRDAGPLAGRVRRDRGRRISRLQGLAADNTAAGGSHGAVHAGRDHSC